MLADLNMSPAANRGAVLTLLHPVDRTPLKQADGSVLTITLLGRDSDEFIKAERRARKAARESILKRMPYSPADEDRQANIGLAACTLAWNGIPTAWLTEGGVDETPAPFTPDNAAQLYGNPGVGWLRDQVDEFITERANFLKAAPLS